MADDLVGALKIAASGLQVQSTRMRVVTENLANANSTGQTDGADPYARQLVSFATELDRASGLKLARVSDILRSDAPFRTRYDPSHPAADEKGYVRLPNVNTLVELADMREANRSYEANVQTIRQVRDLISMTIDLLRRS